MATDKQVEYFFKFTPRIGVEQFCVDLNGIKVDAYFRCRSTICGRSVCDLDFKSMTSS